MDGGLETSFIKTTYDISTPIQALLPWLIHQSKTISQEEQCLIVIGGIRMVLELLFVITILILMSLSPGILELLLVVVALRSGQRPTTNKFQMARDENMSDKMTRGWRP